MNQISSEINFLNLKVGVLLSIPYIKSTAIWTEETVDKHTQVIVATPIHPKRFENAIKTLTFCLDDLGMLFHLRHNSYVLKIQYSTLGQSRLQNYNTYDQQRINNYL
jgi:hypothetical protein